MRVLRYVRVSSNSQKVDRQVEEGDRTRYSFFLEEKVSGKTELFQREKGSIIKELILEGKIDVVSIYSVDRISRNLKDLLSVIDFFHENGVALQIDNLGGDFLGVVNLYLNMLNLQYNHIFLNPQY